MRFNGIVLETPWIRVYCKCLGKHGPLGPVKKGARRNAQEERASNSNAQHDHNTCGRCADGQSLLLPGCAHIHEADNAQIEKSGNGTEEHCRDNGCGIPCGKGRLEKVELAGKTAGWRNASERKHEDQHADRKQRVPGGHALAAFYGFTRLFAARAKNEDGECPHIHKEIDKEIAHCCGHATRRSGSNAQQGVARVGNG